MNKTLISVLKYAIGLGLGVSLLYLALKDVEFSKVKRGFEEANYLWVGLGLIVAILSHWFRAARWKMLIKAAGYESSTVNLFASTMVGYMVNQAVPRLGEVTKATLTSKTEKLPISVSIGTMVTDRIFDVICLGLLLGTVLLLQYEEIMFVFDQAFAGSESAGQEESGGSLLLPILAGVFVLGAILTLVFRKQLAKIPLINKIFNFIGSVWEAILSVRKMKNPLLFLFYTISIWGCYILMTYLVFFALEQTSNLPFIFALTAFVMGGIGMVIPSPGGVGSYHFAIIMSFVGYATILGFTKDEAQIVGTNIAFIIHTSQFLMMIVVGFLAYLFLVPKIRVADALASSKEASSEVPEPSEAG